MKAEITNILICAEFLEDVLIDSIQQLITQVASVAKAGPNQSQEPRTQFWAPTWVEPMC